MSHSILHAAAYALDPEFHRHQHDADGEVMTGLYDVMKRLLPDDDDLNAAKEQYADFKNCQGDFLKHGPNKSIWKAVQAMPAYKWWMCRCTFAKQLRFVAVKVLACTTTSSACERNWSGFEHIQSKKRNKLAFGRLDDIMFVYHNMQLLRRQADDARKRKLEPTVPWQVMQVSDSEEDAHIS